MQLVQIKYDVAIIGGGLSGLASAVLLNEAGKSVIVLEAKKLMGGRICSITDDKTGKHIADIGRGCVETFWFCSF